jgi:hypothetical protein
METVLYNSKETACSISMNLGSPEALDKWVCANWSGDF